MAPHSKASESRGIGSRRSPRVRSESMSSSSSSSSSEASTDNERKTPIKGRSRSDSVSSVTSDSSLASTASSVSHTAEEPVPGTSRDTSRDATIPPVVNGGVRKRTKRSRLTHSKAKRVYKPRKDAIEKTLREEVDNDDFMLADLEWSHWRKAMQRKQKRSSRWEPRSAGHPGIRYIQPFENISHPAVYEVAVKVPDHKEKIPVLASVRQSIKGQSWEAALLPKDKLRLQVDRVLRRGCKLYVRQAPFSVRDMPAIYEKTNVERKKGSARSTDDAVAELRGLMTRVCDYAWREHYDIPSRTYSHRRLVVDKVKVSD